MTALLEARTRAALAKTTLTRVAAMEPEERDAIVRIVDDAIKGLEELLAGLLKTLESSVSLSDTAVVGRVLIKSANLYGSSAELVASAHPALEAWKTASLDRLRRVKDQGSAMLRLTKLPPAAPNVERAGRSHEQMERGEGFSTGELLAELRGE